MGSGASTVSSSTSTTSTPPPTIPEFTIKELPEQIEQSIFIHEKFPLIVDPTNKAKLFLKYQLGSFIKHTEFSQTNLNRALVGALLHGKTLTVSFEDLKGISYDFFIPNYFPKEVLNRSELYKDGVWQLVFHPEEGDPQPDDVTPSPEFVFILCTTSDFIPPELHSIMRVFKIIDKESEQKTEGGGGGGGGGLDEIASLYGASEVKRNSVALVEAGFDGDIDALKELLEKGYHVESMDGRKHTALSEAACQGQIPMMEYLLSLGVDPNTMNDTGRTPLWRASFNGHVEAVRLLLDSGGDPDCRDNSSMESAYDVAKTDEIRELIGKWDRKLTADLKEKRSKEIEAAIIARIQTSAEREEYAKQKLRVEAVQLATSRNLAALKDFFLNLAQEADQSKTKPRITVECRNDLGQSLLSIAAQNNDVPMVTFLLTHWKECDKERWDLATGELSNEAKVFKTNPNSRDLKGWNCVCIAIFHNSLEALQLLLENGGDPSLKSSYNKNGWDLSKDELDAAGKVVRSRQEVRQILIDFENSQSNLTSSKKIFGDGSVSPSREVNMYQDLDHNGSPIVMQMEMENSGDNCGGGKKGGKKSGGGGGSKKKDSGGSSGGGGNNSKDSKTNSSSTDTKKKKTTNKK